MTSPQTALARSCFSRLLLDRFNLLASPGVVLGFLRLLFKRDITPMFKTYFSWIFIAGIGCIVVFLGRVPTIVGVTLVAIYAFKEFAHISALNRDFWMTGAVTQELSLSDSPNFDVVERRIWPTFSFPFFGTWQLILTGLIVGIDGQLGSLSICVIKPDIGAKHMAATFPGFRGAAGFWIGSTV